MIKCIVSDMDGTLLNREETISITNKQAIESAQAEGVEFVIATGRSYIEARHVLDEINLKCSVISINGAVVYNEEGKVVASNSMDIDEYRKARELLDKDNLFYEVFTNKGTFSKDQDYSIATIVDILLTAMPDLDPMYVSEKASERFKKGHVLEIDNYDKLYEMEDIEFYKILVFSADIPLLGKAGGLLKKNTKLAVSSSGKENLEITSLDAQKGIAVEKFVALRDISLNETMAIGDSYNDVSMFEKVGKPVAMGNAPEDIKQLCGGVTRTNNEDGVAHAILRAIKQKSDI